MATNRMQFYIPNDSAANSRSMSEINTALRINSIHLAVLANYSYRAYINIRTATYANVRYFIAKPSSISHLIALAELSQILFSIGTLLIPNFHLSIYYKESIPTIRTAFNPCLQILTVIASNAQVSTPYPLLIASAKL